MFINVWTPTLCFLRHFEYQKRRDEVRFLLCWWQNSPPLTQSYLRRYHSLVRIGLNQKLIRKSRSSNGWRRKKCLLRWKEIYRSHTIFETFPSHRYWKPAKFSLIRPNDFFKSSEHVPFLKRTQSPELHAHSMLSEEDQYFNLLAIRS